MRETSSVKVQTKCVGAGSILLFALAMILLLAAIVNLYVPFQFVSSEHLLSATMLIGIGGGIRHFLSPTVQITLLEIRGTALQFRSHKNPIVGVSFYSPYSKTDSIPLNEITAIQLRSVEVPKVGSFGMAVLDMQDKPEITIWFKQTDYPAVERLFNLIKKSRRSIHMDLWHEH